MKKVTLVLIVSIVFMSGCTQTQKGAAVGAAGGAALGGIIGHQSGSGGEGAAIGAAVGAITGALIADKMEEDEQELPPEQTE